MPDVPKRIEDIIGELAGDKERKIVEFYKSHKGKKISSVDPHKAYEKEQTQIKLKTGTLIDDMVGGGFEAGASMLLYGEFGSGKTETCFTIAVLCPDTVIYIDTEGSFKWSRIKEMCDARDLDYKKVFDKIKLYQPANWVELLMLLGQLPSPADEGIGKIGLIIIDSLTKLFRGIEFAGRQELFIKQPPLRELMITSTEIAKTYECAVIFTTQIYESPNAQAFMPEWASQKPVGGASIEHQASYVMFLRRAQGNCRIARLVDADWKPLAERPYMITNKGIDDMPDTETAKKVIEKAEDYEKKLAEAMKDVEKKKKRKGEQESEPEPQSQDVSQPQPSEVEPQPPAVLGDK
jgi:DNA repair protein RadA